jgi:hypothetical protein
MRNKNKNDKNVWKNAWRFWHVENKTRTIAKK